MNRRGRPQGTVLNGELLRWHRARVGLTQEELAERLHLTARTISSAERQTTVSIRTARVLAGCFGVPMDDLVLEWPS